MPKRPDVPPSIFQALAWAAEERPFVVSDFAQDAVAVSTVLAAEVNALRTALATAVGLLETEGEARIAYACPAVPEAVALLDVRHTEMAAFLATARARLGR